MSLQRKVYILRGPSGTGKSTLAKELAGENGIIIEADQFFTDEKGNYHFDASKLGVAHNHAKRRFLDAINRSTPSVVVSNTSTTKKEMAFYAKEAVKRGYEVEIKEPDWHPDLKTKEGKWNIDFIEKLQKNKDRAKSNKSLPREVIEKMVKRYEYSPTLEEILGTESF